MTPLRTGRTGLLLLVSAAFVAAAFVLSQTPGSQSIQPHPGAKDLDSTLGFTPQRWRSLIETRDATVVHCMRDAGFRFRSDTDWAFFDTAPHGPFEVTTPTSVPPYLRANGYGMVQRIRSLIAAKRDLDRTSNEEYYKALSRPAKRQFQRALLGDGSEDSGCRGRGLAATGGIILPGGGRLGEDYGEAMGRLFTSKQYLDWEETVLACVKASGAYGGDADSLVELQRPYLERLIAITGSQSDEGSDGLLHYSLQIPPMTPAVRADLAALRRSELALGRVEAECRDRHEPEVRELMAAVSVQVLDSHEEEIAQLRQALETTVSTQETASGKGNE